MNRPRLLLASFLVAASVGVVFAQQTRPADTRATSQPTQSATTKPEPAAQLLCPVTQQPIDRRHFARFRGRWVYFAHDAARQKFEADPYQFVDGVQAQWAADAPCRVQIKCPVTGEAPSPDIYVDPGPDAVFFASEAARQKWQQDQTGEYRKRLESECYTFQTRCAACTNPINPAVRRSFDGRALYFCCRHCPDGFERNKVENLARVDREIEENRARCARR